MQNQVLLQHLFCADGQSLYKRILLIMSGVILLTFASQLNIPLKPVPLTFQSTAVILIGMAYGWRRGCEVILAYYTAGLAGLPVFAEWHFGLQVFFGATGGYLIGLLPATALSGYLAQRGWGRNYISSFLASLLSVSLIFILGLLQLAQFVPWHSALLLGLMPFLFSELIKLSVLAWVIPKLWRKSSHDSI